MPARLLLRPGIPMIIPPVAELGGLKLQLAQLLRSMARTRRSRTASFSVFRLCRFATSSNEATDPGHSASLRAKNRHSDPEYSSGENATTAARNARTISSKPALRFAPRPGGRTDHLERCSQRSPGLSHRHCCPSTVGGALGLRLRRPRALDRTLSSAAPLGLQVGSGDGTATKVLADLDGSGLFMKYLTRGGG